MNLNEKFYEVLQNTNNKDLFQEFYDELFPIISYKINGYMSKHSINYTIESQDLYSTIYYFVFKHITIINSYNMTNEEKYKKFWIILNYKIKYEYWNVIRNHVKLYSKATSILSSNDIDDNIKNTGSNENIENNIASQIKFMRILQAANQYQKKIIILKLKGYSFKEISKILNMKINKVNKEWYSLRNNKKLLSIYKDLQ